SYKGRLYVGGDDSTGDHFKVFVYEGDGKWEVAGQFPMRGPEACFPHPMGVHDGRLYVSGIVPSAAMRPAVHAFDGATWSFCGNPVDSNQVHSLEVYRGDLYAGTWPEGRIGRYAGGQVWDDCGRPGDSTEINALCVYNGGFYAGSIPRGEVYRYEGSQEWTRLARFRSPEGWEPIPVDNLHIPDHVERVKEWTRVTSLSVFAGRLYGSIASCTAAVQDAPLDVRGRIYSMEAGCNASYDRDLGLGWHHLAAVRREGRLELYVDGSLEAVSRPFDPAHYDLDSGVPLTIGAGELASFRGCIRDVRLYGQALAADSVQALWTETRPLVPEGS
ncbi:MAG: LamG-like jellyroll fold domain-containing protein, partial [Anaerolineae bacterium]